jgi:hypothetical protein
MDMFSSAILFHQDLSILLSSAITPTIGAGRRNPVRQPQKQGVLSPDAVSQVGREHGYVAVRAVLAEQAQNGATCIQGQGYESAETHTHGGGNRRQAANYQ